MSISKVIVQFSALPSLFKQELTSLIQRQVSTPEDFKSILNSFDYNLPPCKAMPIVKQQYFKSLIKKQFVQQSIINLYYFMTEKAYTIQEKTHVSNLVFKLIYLISQISMTKEKWKLIFNREVDYLAQRFTFLNQQKNHQNYTPAVLTIHQAETLKQYITQAILPFYQIWEKLLDQNQYLLIDSCPFEPVKLQGNFPNLSQGKKLQINEILALDLLKEYLSDKAPVEQKKDPKKK